METIVITTAKAVAEGMGGREAGTTLGFDYGAPLYEVSDFRNPTDDKPMKASEFLSRLDLSKVIEVIGERYGNKDWHFKYPIEAIIKAQALKYILGLRWDTSLVRYLKEHPDDAKLLGFKEVDGKVKLPTQQTYSYFIARRLGQEGLYDLFDGLVLAIKDEMVKMGLKLGRNVSIDSTPLASVNHDKEAAYNPHYGIRGYKVHGAIDTDYFLPLALNFTTAIDGDSPYYVPLLDRLQMLGMEFEKVFADGAYASFENFAVVCQKYKAKPFFNLREDAKFREDGTPEGVQRTYNKLWQTEGYKPDAGLDYMLTFLFWHEKLEVVGAYYRNKHMREWESDPFGTKFEYNRRASIEAFHGHLKQQMNLEAFLDKGGLVRAEEHVLSCYISLLCVALCRIQHGITDGLVNIKCLA